MPSVKPYNVLDAKEAFRFPMEFPEIEGVKYLEGARCDRLLATTELIEELCEVIERKCWSHYGEDFWTAGERGDPHWVPGKHGYHYMKCLLSDQELAILSKKG